MSARKARDLAWLKRAVAVARRGLGATYPNPSVGAVVVRSGSVLGSAHSDRTGGDHAEVRALRKAGAAARGSTLYVTLEPCDHHGRTPPCTASIIAAGVRRVVIGLEDPAGHVRGRGIKRLRAAGIAVEVGIGAAACEVVHEHYVHHVHTGTPFVTLKSATSLDGRIATASGDSKWITQEPARREGHRLRARHHAIAVGRGTVVADDPALSVRLVRGVSPLRVVFDSRLRVADARATLQIVAAGTLILHTHRASAAARRRAAERGAETIEIDADPSGRVDVVAALRELGRRDVRSLLVEGGGGLVGAFVAAQAWQRWHWFQAPCVLGDGRGCVSGYAPSTVAQAGRLNVERRARVGEDWLTVLTPVAR